MYKSISKRLQRIRENTSPPILDRDTIYNNNERRCPFFFILYQASKRHKTCPQSFPEWLKNEIYSCGGIDKWVRRNFYWQKWYRQHLYKTFQGARDRGSTIIEPRWFRKEINAIGQPEWLKIFSVRQENHITKRDGIKTIIVRNGQKVTSVLDKKALHTALSEINSNTIQINPTKSIKSCLMTQKFEKKKKVKQKNKKRKKRINEDAMFHVVSGGGFETNRSRH